MDHLGPQTRWHRRQRRSVGALVALAAGLLLGLSFTGGCADEGPERLDAEEQALHITPRVEITGLQELDPAIFLQDLYMGVGEIRLEPLSDDLDEIVYVTRTPLFFHFDLASGQYTLEGAPITLPHGGEYMISIHLEPIKDGLEDEGWFGKSIRIDGLIAHTSTSDDDDNERGNSSKSNEPMPLPWLTDGEDPNPGIKTTEWVPWTFYTHGTADLTLNTVRFSDTSDQSLVISIDMLHWLDDVIVPITAAAVDEHIEDQEAINGEGGSPGGNAQGAANDPHSAPIDITETLEAQGLDLEELGAYSSVAAR